MCRETPAQMLLKELHSAVSRVLSFSAEDHSFSSTALDAALEELSSAESAAIRFADAVELLQHWNALKSDATWRERDTLYRNAVRTQLLTAFGGSLSVPDTRLTMLATGRVEHVTGPSHIHRGQWHPPQLPVHLSEQLALVAAHANTAISDAYTHILETLGETEATLADPFKLAGQELYTHLSAATLHYRKAFTSRTQLPPQ